MAEENKPAEGGAEAAPKKKLEPTTALLLVNFIVTAAAAGTLLYTKILYKPPVITETSEMEQIKAKEPASKEKAGEHPLWDMGEVRVNIASKESEKSHYAVFQLVIELADEDSKGLFEDKKPQVSDSLIALMNKKQLSDLNTVHGRLLLKEELISEFNRIVGDGAVLEIYFNNFLLQ